MTRGETGPTVAVTTANLATIASRGIAVPGYDRSRLVGRIAHIGVGGFHRAHLAAYTDDLAADGSDWGIRGLGLLAGDQAMADALAPQDHLYTLIERGAEEPRAAVIGSVVDYLAAATRVDEAVAWLADPAVAIVSMTITEAGYSPGERDRAPTFDVIAAALATREASGAGPVTILSCDNLPGNGDAARSATLSAARRISGELETWIDANCTFPCSMVDRITPVTADDDRRWLADRHGIADRWPVVAEPFRQWVVEDTFVAGRPDWSAAGVLFRDDVERWEEYKLRLLNATHSSMAYLCALAGFTLVDAAMADTTVRDFLVQLLTREAIPAVEAIPGYPPTDYAATVLERFANPGVRDQIARLCIDGSAKFPTFLLPTIDHQLRHGGPIGRATTALAGWARYLATVPIADQAYDASGDEARRCALAAADDPVRFLDFATVFPPEMRNDARLRAAFSGAARAVAELGPLGAMAAADGVEPEP